MLFTHVLNAPAFIVASMRGVLLIITVQHSAARGQLNRAGADQGGGFIGFGRTPLTDNKFFEAFLIGKGLNLVR